MNEPYFKDDLVTLWQGNSRLVLPEFDENSLDSCVTDPPYELGFMGKSWDSTGIAYNADLWRAVYRVLKPGAYLLAFGGTRTYHRMACAIEDAGFEIRDQIQWIYASGFPKSLDVNKQFCNCENYEQASTATTEHDMRPLFDADLSPQIQSGSTGGQILQSSVSEPSAHQTVLWSKSEKGLADGEKPSLERWGDVFQKEGQLHRGAICESSRMGETDGPQGWVHNGAPSGNGSDVRSATNTGGSGQSQRSNAGEQSASQSRTLPDECGPQARRSDEVCARCGKSLLPQGFDRSQITGLGTALKPANEPICLARKPLEKGLTVAQNVLKWGTGAINIDGCRVEGEVVAFNYFETGSTRGYDGGIKGGARTGGMRSNGRWPANVIHDGSDEVLAGFPETTSGSLELHHKRTGGKPPIGTFTIRDRTGEGEFIGDSGSAARFFYCAKASKADRNHGTETNGNAVLAHNSTPRQQEDADWQSRGGNHHPTVKPVDLMRYLCRLITPPGGTVLDPFLGSGSTAKAALIERFKVIGIELDAEYLAIAEARCKELQVKLF